MTSADTYPRWVAGHHIEGSIYEFPHICPGEGCAIAAWLVRKNERLVYESLQRETKAV